LSVTYNAAKSLKRNEDIGLIQEGYNADILLWNINDLREIPYWHDSANIKIDTIIKKGLIYN